MAQRTGAPALERPKLLQAALDAFRQPDLRRKILLTLGLLAIFRFIAHVPVPGVDFDRLAFVFRQSELLGMLNLFSGGALQNLSIASLGVYPYITSTIVMQIMIPVIPRLGVIAKEGESGRQRISQYTHWLTVPLAFGQSYGQLALLQGQGVLTGVGFGGGDALSTLTMMFTMAAGTMFLVWLGELITENGIGNGISLIIFAGIVASLPSLLGSSFLQQNPAVTILSLAAVGVFLIGAIIFFQEAQRRVPVQYSRSLFRGGRMYRQSGGSHIPLRVNSAGMIPLIFAISVMILPGTVASYFATGEGWVGSVALWITSNLTVTSWLYWAIYFVLVVGFTFFYTMVIFQQQNLSENLQRQGGFVPGIRPGRPTQEYLQRIIVRITWAGALFLGFIAIVPWIASLFVPGVTGLQISSTALLIVVGVVLDTLRQLESQLLMRNYEGFIR